VRLAIRQSRSRGVWAAILALLDSPEFAGVLPKEQLGKAISYLRNHAAALEVFLGDPAVPIAFDRSGSILEMRRPAKPVSPILAACSARNSLATSAAPGCGSFHRLAPLAAY